MTPAAPHWAQPARALRPAARPDLGSQHCHTSRSFVIASALRVEITCGAAIETEHPILCAVADGRIIVSIGDIDRVNLARSAVKPLQAFPLVASAAADDAELAIACASHSGESGDVRIVTHWLTRLGLSREPPVRAGPARRLPHARPPPRRRPLPLLRRGGTGAAGRAAAVGRQLRLPPGQLGHRGRRLRRPVALVSPRTLARGLVTLLQDTEPKTRDLRVHQGPPQVHRRYGTLRHARDGSRERKRLHQGRCRGKSRSPPARSGDRRGHEGALRRRPCQPSGAVRPVGENRRTRSLDFPDLAAAEVFNSTGTAVGRIAVRDLDDVRVERPT